MTFDEDLTRAFDALSDRLHAEVQHQIDAAMAALRAAAPIAPPEPAPAPPPEPGPPPAVAEPDSTVQDLVAAMRTLDDARSLTEVLDALATGAAQHSRSVTVRLRRGGDLHTWRSIAASADGNAAGATRHPLVISGEEIGDLYAEGGAPDALEILARHASRCLESITAFKTARALARQPDSPTDEPLGEEETSARRYAKLLVSEIKLYHEADVLAGRRERDLASRLGGEIARARVLYDQRVAPHVRQRANYFHDELVRTLADGDSTLLEFHA